MANPRPGIINLDFADVSEQARRIAENDPLRQTLRAAGTGIDMLAERDRQLAYLRQMAAKDGVKLTDEQRGTTTGEGIGKATDWIGGKAGAIKDKLFAPENTEQNTPVNQAPPPFSLDVVAEKSTAPIFQGERTDVDPFDSTPRTMTVDPQMSKLQAPEAEVPEQNVRVQFPTSIISAPVAQNKPEQKTETKTSNASEPTAFTSPNLAWSEMYRLNPDRAKFDYTREADIISKSNAAKNKTQGLLREVAADFANIDPTDQTGWDDARTRWISIDPNLRDFVPESASQDAWDRIQLQGGLAKNVQPKGGFAQRKYLEDQVKQNTFLSMAARNAGKSSEADYYANKALTTQKLIDGGDKTANPTTDEIVKSYKEEIDELKSQTTKDRVADPSVLFADIATKYGEGATLDAVKSNISTQLEKEREAKGGITQYSDDEQQKQANIYNAKATQLSEDHPKILGAIELLQRGINAGAAGMSSKTLQGDVLAEAEIKRYISGGEYDQWKNKIREAVGLAPTVRAGLVAELVNSLINVYNAQVRGYNAALANNKYKMKLQTLPTVNASGKANVPETPNVLTDAKGRKYTLDANRKRIYQK